MVSLNYFDTYATKRKGGTISTLHEVFAKQGHVEALFVVKITFVRSPITEKAYLDRSKVFPSVQIKTENS